MDTEDIATGEQLLNQATEVLKAANNKGCGPNVILDQLFQLSLELRRELDGAKRNFNSSDPVDSLPAADTWLMKL